MKEQKLKVVQKGKKGAISKKVAPSSVPGEKPAAGRPTLYKDEYNEQARKLCLLGATDKEMADFFGVVESTLNLWKIEQPSFSESITRGKEIADAEIAESLYHRAKGYSHPDSHITTIENKVVITPITKHYPPDTPAASLWLRNRRPKDWRDKQDLSLQNPDGSALTINIVKFSETKKAGQK